MKTCFINLVVTDGTTHQGVLFDNDKKSDSIVIHIHGMAGNFYENTFIPVMAENYTKAGYAFLSVNNRGHDYICDCKKYHKENVESYKAGSIYEVFVDCVYDINGYVKFAVDSGYKNIYLQGHSSGANKIVYSFSKIKTELAGLILLSPCDDLGIQIDSVGIKNRQKYIDIAEEHIVSGNDDEIMPDGTFFTNLLSAHTFLESFVDDSPFDCFPYRNPKNDFKYLSEINVPVFVSFGNNGDYLQQSFETVKEIIKNKMKNTEVVNVVEIDGAPHNYFSREETISEKVCDWLEQNKKD